MKIKKMSQTQKLIINKQVKNKNKANLKSDITSQYIFIFYFIVDRSVLIYGFL